VSNQEDPLATASGTFGKEVAASAQLGRKIDPPRFEADFMERFRIDPADRTHAVVIHRAAVDVHCSLQEVDRLLRMTIDVLDESKFDRRQT
jgi:hypothetical protein